MCTVGTSHGYCVQGACRESVCGDGIVSQGEVCDDGNVDPRDGCAADCRSTELCGNGIADFAVGEECDDGNQETNDRCHPDCKIARCGDGVLDPDGGEACDDGAANGNTPDTACRTNCQPRRCGDGVLDTGEVCDDGNLASGDGCAGDCLSKETCGNGVVDLAASEACDDGNAVDTDRCRNNCQLAACGDGVVQAVNGESCDAGAQNSAAPDAACRTNCQPQRCGDGVTDMAAGEVCDDGALVSGDGCSADCRSLEVCGNDIVDGVTGEQCDSGIAGLSNDGCSSRCLIEAHAWDTADSPQIPARFFSAAAWDAARGEVVMFGGDDEDHCFADTWIWNGTNWDWRDTPVAPPPRQSLGMAYDAARKQVVMFGGTDQHQPTTVFFNDTWLWDGDSWTKASPAHSPPASFSATLAYDSDLQRTLMVSSSGETWSWDGADWTKLAIPALGALDHPALAYDPVRHVMVLLPCVSGDADTAIRELGPTGWGPESAQRIVAYAPVVAAAPTGGVFVFSGDGTTVWNYDGTWHSHDAGVLLPSFSSGAYDPVRNTLVSIGGFGPISPGVIYALPNTLTMPVPSGTWTLQTPVAPSARQYASMTYDRARGQLVMFGGLGTGNVFTTNTTWIHRGHSWARVTPTGASPPARYLAGMTFDETTHEVLLFGGQGAGGPLDDMWSFDGSTWTLHTTADPHPQGSVYMAFDAATGETIVLAGTARDEVWSYKNDHWTYMGTVTSFGEPVITYDRERRVIVVSDTASVASVYEWDGVTWTEVHPGGPPARSAAMMTYDERRKRVVLFGGYDYLQSVLGDTWEWDGTTWTRLVATTPARRQGGVMAYDARMHSTIAFGGGNSVGAAGLLATTWAFERTAPGDTGDLCEGVSDTDGDGKTGCADPDCYARCTPFCAPGEPSCVAGQPRCGDGVCSALEGRGLCPADCP